MSAFLRTGVLLAALGGALLAAGCGDSIVGAQCADGFAEQDGACVEGVPGQASGTGSGSSNGGAGGDGGGTAAGPGPIHPSPTSASSGVGAGNTGSGGVPTCEAGETACGGQCTDTQSDPDNCGACGIACPTEVCTDGFCEGTTAGHNVILGMAFETVQAGSPAAILLGNSVFVASNEPVRVLEYKQFASASSPPKVKALLQNEAKKRQRTMKFANESSWNELPDMLHVSTYDVLVLHNQDTAPAGKLAEVGSGLATALAGFLSQGGVVVTLATATGTNEMDELLTTGGLLQTTGLTTVVGQNVYNQGFLDVLGQNVLSPFLAKASSAKFTTSEVPAKDTSFVVVSGDDAPVAIHKVVPIE